MEEIWKANTLTESEAKQWRSRIKERIRKRRNTVEREHANQAQAAYRQLKTKLQFERTYLTTRDREAREVMTRLRGGTHELRIETGRYAITNRDRPLELNERRCLICLNGEIEEENCNVYDDLRAKMLDAVSSALSKEGVEVQESKKGERRL